MLKSSVGSVLRGLNNGDMGKCISKIPKFGTKYIKFFIKALLICNNLCMFLNMYYDQSPKPANANYPFLFFVAGILPKAVSSSCCFQVTCLHGIVESVFIYLSFTQAAYIYCAPIYAGLCAGYVGRDY